MNQKFVLLMAFMGLILLFAGGETVLSQERPSYPVDSEPYGTSYETWTQKWWQWLLSIPTSENPAIDTTGKYCGVGQNGSVWFLAGTTGGKNIRTCTIPSGVSILIPVLNSECSEAEFPDLTTEAELRACAKQFQDQTQQLEFVLDGTVFEQSEIPRVVTPLFNVSFPEDNIFGAPAGMAKVISDGNWVFLRPLPEGEHEIAAKGVSLDLTTTATNTFVSDVTYHLRVQ
jgi:hypothetical protein